LTISNDTIRPYRRTKHPRLDRASLEAGYLGRFRRAVMLVALGLLPWSDALKAAAKGFSRPFQSGSNRPFSWTGLPGRKSSII
jgi:hypothetical protein